jgi:hypothetical protein
MNESRFGKHRDDRLVLFGAYGASEHLERGVALANISIDDHRLLVAMDPDPTVLDHLLAFGRIEKALLDAFEDFGLLDPAFVLREDQAATKGSEPCKEKKCKDCRQDDLGSFEHWINT